MKYKMLTWIITGSILSMVMAIDIWLGIKARRKYKW